MFAPGMRPNCATVVEVCACTSSTAPSEISGSRLPKALVAGSVPPLACAGRPPAATPVLALTPSMVKELVLGRWPVAVNWPGFAARGGHHVDAGNHLDQIEQTAAVQRQPRDLAGSKARAGGCVGVVQQRGRAVDVTVSETLPI